MDRVAVLLDGEFVKKVLGKQAQKDAESPRGDGRCAESSPDLTAFTLSRIVSFRQACIAACEPTA